MTIDDKKILNMLRTVLDDDYGISGKAYSALMDFVVEDIYDGVHTKEMVELINSIRIQDDRYFIPK
jgi:hypothetical protein